MRFVSFVCLLSFLGCSSEEASGPEESLATIESAGPIGLSPTHIYWVEGSTLMTVPRQGGPAQVVTAEGPRDVLKLQVTTDDVFWLGRGELWAHDQAGRGRLVSRQVRDFETNSGALYALLGDDVVKLSLVGGATEKIADADGAMALGVELGRVVWSRPALVGESPASVGGIYAAPLEGGPGERLVPDSSEMRPLALAADGGKAYWLSGGAIKEVDLNTGATHTLVSGLVRARDVHIAGRHLYWHEGRDGETQEQIRRISVNGGEPEHVYATTGTVGGFAVADGSVYATVLGEWKVCEGACNAVGAGTWYVDVASGGQVLAVPLP